MSELQVILEIPGTKIQNLFMSKKLHCFFEITLSGFFLILILMNLCLIKKVTWNSLMFFQSFISEVIYNTASIATRFFSLKTFSLKVGGKKKTSPVNMLTHWLIYFYSLKKIEEALQALWEKTAACLVCWPGCHGHQSLERKYVSVRWVLSIR